MKDGIAAVVAAFGAVHVAVNCAGVADAAKTVSKGEPFPIAQGAKAIDVTLSIGLAALTGPQDTGATILKRADQALYRAKRDGRNRVVADAA